MEEKTNKTETKNRDRKRTLLQRLVRFLSVWIEGTDYRDRYLNLAEQFALSDILLKSGRFKDARGKWRGCIVRGIVVRYYYGDYLIIDYLDDDENMVRGAQISRDKFVMGRG